MDWQRRRRAKIEVLDGTEKKQSVAGNEGQDMSSVMQHSLSMWCL